MPEGMTFETYLRQAERTAKLPLSVCELAMGMVGELGEFVDEIKKQLYHGHPRDRDHEKEELGDIFWYLFMLCKERGLDPDEIARKNIEKLWRRYPSGFDSVRSINRED